MGSLFNGKAGRQFSQTGWKSRVEKLAKRLANGLFFHSIGLPWNHSHTKFPA